MTRTYLMSAALILVGLSGCGGNGDDKLADRVEDAADSRAEALDDRADAMREQAAGMEERAEDVRETGEQRSDAIDAADVDAHDMGAEQKNEIVAGTAPAVR